MVELAPQVAVITPSTLSSDRASFLLPLYRSVASQETSWEWIICLDGCESGVPDQILADPRVRVTTTGRTRRGAAIARNLGLQMVRAPWVTSVDDDDILPAGSLTVRMAATDSAPGVGWVAGLLADLLPDGSTTVWDAPCPRGMLPAGRVWEAWSEPAGCFPLGPTCMLTKTDLLRRVGGWQGLPQGEDFGMVMAVTGAAPGKMLDDVVYLYRKHPGQMTKAEDFDEFELTIRRITFERGRLSAHAA